MKSLQNEKREDPPHEATVTTLNTELVRGGRSRHSPRRAEGMKENRPRQTNGPCDKHARSSLLQRRKETGEHSEILRKKTFLKERLGPANQSSAAKAAERK